MGNITRDPELRYTPQGNAVVNLSLAINNKFKNRAGETKEEVVFVGVVAWGGIAESCNQYLTKGSPIFVEGRLKQDTYEKDGKKQTKTKVTAERIQFLGTKKKEPEAQPDDFLNE